MEGDFFWGCGDCTGELMITVGIPEADLRRAFPSVTAAQTIPWPYVMPYENNLTIYVCRKTTQPLKVLWPGLAHFD